MSAFDRLLRVLRPAGAGTPLQATDAELAALGIALAVPEAQGELLRFVAAAGPVLPDVLAAALCDLGLPRAALQGHAEALVAAGHLIRTPAGLALAPRWQGAFADFARLTEVPAGGRAPGASLDANAAPDAEPDAVPFDLTAGLAALAAVAQTKARPTPAEAAAVFLKAVPDAASPEAAAALIRAIAELPPIALARLRYFAAALAPRGAAPGPGPAALAGLVAQGVTRVQRAAAAALADGPEAATAVDALIATQLGFHRALGDLLPAERLERQVDRRQELLRRLCHFLAVPILRETPPVSVRRLLAVDVRRIEAELSAREIDAACREEYDRLLAEERARRKAAAEAYASGRRE